MKKKKGYGVRSTLLTDDIHKKVGSDFPGETFRVSSKKENHYGELLIKGW
jgi:hypothetical protein